MGPELEQAFGILAAALGGAAVGVERQRSGHADGPAARFGGVRTFTLLGGLAGLTGWLWQAGFPSLAVVLLAAAGALVVAGYASASRHDVDATTEVSAIVVLAAGVVAATGHITLASGVIAVTCLLLIEKSRLHRWVTRLDDAGLRAGTRFAVMATVVLPLLPTGPFGPLGGVKPRQLWALVLFFSGLSFIGYIARRAIGARHGYPLAGALGGIISSTNVTMTFSRESRTHKSLARPLAIGVLAASTVLFLRVLVAASVLNRTLAIAVLPYVLIPFGAGLLPLAFTLRLNEGQEAPIDEGENPLQIRSALQMAVLFQLVLFAVAFVGSRYGQPGLLISGAVLGLTDLDALTFSMAQSAAAGAPVAVAARALGIGLLSNTLLKLVVAVVVGGPGFRWVAASGLSCMALALAGSLLMM